MKKISIILLLLICLQFKGLAQESINQYKYIIVPTSYSFLNEADKYQLNSLTKFLFNKYGYTAFFANEEFPQDLTENRCLGLYADVVEDKSLFKTKLRIDLKDCGGRLAMSSKVGETREKDFAKAYNLALRDAFETFQNTEYKYEPVKTDNVVKAKQIPVEKPVVKEKVMEPVNKEMKPMVEEKKEVVEVAETPRVVEEKPKMELKEDVAEVVETPKPIREEPKLEVKETKVEFVEQNKNLLYAQPIENGYQIVDTTPKIVMILLETARSDVYMVKGENAMVYKEDGTWFISKNDGSKVTVEALNIKF